MQWGKLVIAIVVVILAGSILVGSANAAPAKDDLVVTLQTDRVDVTADANTQVFVNDVLVWPVVQVQPVPVATPTVPAPPSGEVALGGSCTVDGEFFAFRWVPEIQVLQPFDGDSQLMLDLNRRGSAVCDIPDTGPTGGTLEWAGKLDIQLGPNVHWQEARPKGSGIGGFRFIRN